ncbi:MAG: hypothetical protein AAFY34_03835 [Pseudomonadota bacterium]
MSNPRQGTSWYLNSEIGGLDGTTMTAAPLFRFRHLDVNITNSELKDRLKLQGMRSRKLERITDQMRDMANGRKANLAYCEQLGISVGSETQKEDLFL